MWVKVMVDIGQDAVGCQSGRPGRIRQRPLEGAIGDLFPAGAGDHQVRATVVGVVLGDRALGLVVLGVRGLHSGRHDVVLGARQEQQRCAVGILEVDPGVLVARLEIGEHRVEQDASRRRDVIALVERQRFLVGVGVGEGVLPLLGVEPDCPAVVERVLEHREHRVQLRPRRDPNAFGGRRVESDAGAAVAVVHHDLHERPTGRVTHQNRLGVERVEKRFEVGDDRLDCEVGDRCRIRSQRLHLDVEARVGGCVDREALGFVAGLPVLPGAGRDPESVD